MKILTALSLFCIFLMANPIEIRIDKKNEQEKYIKDLNLIGDWNIETQRYFINFILTAGSNWNISFEKITKFYLIINQEKCFGNTTTKKGK